MARFKDSGVGGRMFEFARVNLTGVASVVKSGESTGRAGVFDDDRFASEKNMLDL